MWVVGHMTRCFISDVDGTMSANVEDGVWWWWCTCVFNLWLQRRGGTCCAFCRCVRSSCVSQPVQNASWRQNYWSTKLLLLLLNKATELSSMLLLSLKWCMAFILWYDSNCIIIIVCVVICFRFRSIIFHWNMVVTSRRSSCCLMSLSAKTVCQHHTNNEARMQVCVAVSRAAVLSHE